jgi:hypothetical protein
MTQTRLESLIESIVNVVIGFGINYFANFVIFPHFGFHLSASANLAMGAIYTVISVTRSYCIRRWFNNHLNAMTRALATFIIRIRSNA